MSFELLEAEVNKGLLGRNRGIPIGFPRLNKYIGIRKSVYFLLGGLTGSGKTTFVDEAFVLNPYDYWLLNKKKVKLKVIYRSMERSKIYKLAKWMTRKIFLEQAIVIPIDRMLGWGEDNKMSKDEHDLFLMYRDYFKEMLESVVTIIDGTENPIGIAKDLKEHAESRGKIEQLDKYNKVYIPNDEDEITIVVIDHVGKLKLTKDLNTKKQVIDKLSDELAHARDLYGYTPVAISQFNREIANPIRIKNGDVEPQLEDFKESSNTQEDAEVILALFDPMRYKVEDPSGYDLSKLRDNTGAKYFRSLRLIKNSLGTDDVRIGLGFYGEIGTFRELKKRVDMQQSDYENVINKSLFLR